MRNVFYMASGVGLGMIIQACATTDPFPYPSYGIDMATQMLLADTVHGKPDLPLTSCDANPTSASPCIAFMESDYLSLKSNYEKISAELAQCQNQLKSN